MFGLDALTARGRVALTTTAVLTAGVVALSLVAYAAVVSAATGSLDDALLQEVDAFSAAITPRDSDDNRDLGEVSRTYLEGRAGAESARPLVILIALESGRVISNSETRLEDAPGNAERLDVSSMEPGMDTLVFESTTYRVVTTPVASENGERVGVLQVASPTEQIEELQRSLALSLAVTGLIVVALGAVISRWAASRSLAPVNEIAATAARVTKSSLGERIDYAGPPDELGALAGTIDQMLDRLEAAFEEQHSFVADASHELRTPIAVIRGNLDLMAHPATTDEERSQLIEVVDEEVRRMTRIVEDLLALARLRSGPPRPFQPLAASVLVEEVASRAKVLSDRVLSCECIGDPWISGDPDLLEQALLNVVKNAIEHTEPGGHIKLACSQRGEIAVVTVADDGAGVPEEALGRLFDRFFRVTGERRSGSGGSGLGLAITKRLVELHEGTIGVANLEGGGAEFRVELPRIEPSRVEEE